MSEVKFYPPFEEKLNIGSHALGLILGLIGLPLLLATDSAQSSWAGWLGKLVFALSLVVLYSASTLYHLAKDPVRRQRLRVLDHAAIYVLIAGTYTPIMLVTLAGHPEYVTLGYGILIAAWSMAALGIVLKLFFTGRFSLISTLLYVFMGWAIAFAIKPLAASMASEGLYWLIGGGISYTLGAILYAIKAIPFNHAIFHLFVLLGSACHFVCIYKYV
ncbi:PAQR family membrane homeostasis protein TrhA [Marinicella rhabdoformis]|uniref:PAQR family membrane homeostasis protein TrhA n=1 Tax=Marinicella rhabdoformis TaxID=2580566 RepID=UPI0012AED561|nr:hemolysin III family protein [Marinicella rhabdoformis]